ncbi:phosphoribosylglycinamide formyltransferase [Candidatus Mesenet endosymbiont of Agriotes lineatus]|uniref:phosphoribosylglycinamide formyltransferase n=1 Tax=Candidatus Mesenet endosymbiont of Agriotes lineatus TaxID=3077948 RepID=UPI0030D43C83
MPVKKIKLGVLISGRGSNMQALVNACLDDNFPAQVECVISNNPDAQGMLSARKHNILTFEVENNPLDIYRINTILHSYDVNLVCLAGFMRLLSADFLRKWKSKVINIHPSLLPAFKGLNAQRQALDAGVKITGCTVHYVVPEVDAGPIIFQAAVPVLQNDNVAILSERILKVEHICYPHSVKLIAENKIILKNNIATSSEVLSLI